MPNLTYRPICWLALLLLFGLPGLALAQEPVTYFEHLTFDHGLSDNTVYAIVQDRMGFLWFGTQDGLNRYDGYHVRVFKHNPYDPNSVSNDNAGNLFIDSRGIIWIGTWGGGLDRLDPQTLRFTNYRPDANDPTSLSSDRVQTIFEDRGGAIWVGTAGGGLNELNPETEQFTIYRHNPDDPHSLSNDRIWAITQDDRGFLWIATSEGLNKLDPETGRFAVYYHDPDDPTSLSDSLIRRVYVTPSAGVLWVGTENGLNRYNPDSDTFDRFFNDPDNPTSLSDNIVNAIFEDSRGRLWIGARSGGLNVFDPDAETFSHYQNDPQEPRSLSYNDIRDIMEDSAGVLWFATRGGGASKLTPTSGNFSHFSYRPDQANTLTSNEVRAIYRDQAGLLWLGARDGGVNVYDPQTGQFLASQYADLNKQLTSPDIYAIYQDQAGLFWLGTSGGGLNRYDPRTQTVTAYSFKPGDPTSLGSDDVYPIYEDRAGVLWLGTKGGGLNRFDRQTETFTRFEHNPEDPTTLSNNDVYAILQDRSGVLWVGTYGGGLNKFEPETEQFTIFRHNPDNPDSLSNDNIYDLFEDGTGTLWVATANGGVNKFEPETGRFARYDQTNGLASDVIYAILQDQSNHLWFSTNRGLTKYRPEDDHFSNYDVTDGLPRINFREGAAYRAENGDLYFGGINGMVRFDPVRIGDNLHQPPVVLTGFNRFNQPADLGKPLTLVDNIKLSYEDDVISFEFAALDYVNPAKNRYVYKLEGFDDDWSPVDSRPYAPYTNLDSGDYTFRVKAANNSGVWNEEGLTVGLSITPPFWETWWFRTLLVVAGLGVVLGGYTVRMRAMNLHREMLKAQVAERTVALSEANENLQKITDRLQEEFILAKKIQQALLPPTRPPWSSPDVVCYSLPAYEVGGDFYAYHALNRDRTILIVGDVSGKGMPAALLMAVSQTALQSLLDQALAPGELFRRFNQMLLLYTTATQQNCALCYAELNGSTMRVLNAGGIAPLLRRADGAVAWIDAAGLPLGVPLKNESGQQELALKLAPGDMMIMVSDGVVEAQSAGGEMFSFGRLERAVAAGPVNSAEAMMAHLKREIQAFCDCVEAQDDVTIVVAKL